MSTPGFYRYLCALPFAVILFMSTFKFQILPYFIMVQTLNIFHEKIIKIEAHYYDAIPLF